MERNQQIRKEVLLQLRGATQAISRSPAAIGRDARMYGDNFTDGEILEACLFLEGLGFAEQIIDPATGMRRFKITSKGVLQYEADH